MRRGKELVEFLGSISSRAVQKQLKNLFEKRVLVKSGRPPAVYCSLAGKKVPSARFHVE